MFSMNKKKIIAPIVLLVSVVTLASCLPDGLDTAQGFVTRKNCIFNGFDYQAPGAIAEADHCFTTTDNSTIAPLAEIDSTRTLADLRATQNWDPLDPDHYLAGGTMATRGISEDAPIASNSSDIALFVSDELPRMYLPARWADTIRLGASVGMGTLSNDSIPIYVVDSSNPYQQLQTFSSTFPRVTSFPKLVQMTTGQIPLPTWAEPSIGGDHALAIYDLGTGIWRSYYGMIPHSGGGWDFSSSGHWYGDKGSNKAGYWNYWLGLIQGSSSVVGISNELMQIGPEEVRRDQINHMISMTFPDFKANTMSFPAKQTDGSLDSNGYPNAPEAGQVFTLPKSFDVDSYAATHGLGPTMTAILHAIQDYGGLVTDKNNWVMSLNFENPLGFGVRADDPGNNLWATDPALDSKMTELNRDLNKFPWSETEWLVPDYAGH
jgi:hypothetical protein